MEVDIEDEKKLDDSPENFLAESLRKESELQMTSLYSEIAVKSSLNGMKVKIEWSHGIKFDCLTMFALKKVEGALLTSFIMACNMNSLDFDACICTSSSSK
ncbi:hypothetical protein RJ641_015180 [Dillenia turbinata]|uniref:Uncharacterized protein n=1 Tax=Dillenia turbinata TaxID=194707 RepID=A0AAN8YZW9_9MAGN